MTSPQTRLIAESLGSFGQASGEPVPVVLSHELIGLLSEQMYGSPVKAIEELVVNAYDADARECRITVPSLDNEIGFIAVYDNGDGMDRQTIRDLWNIGRSSKRDEQIQRLRSRKQIGKFGIGKLATYAVATRITYISKKDDEVLAVTLDFSQFEPSPSGQTSGVELPVYEVANDPKSFSDDNISRVLEKLNLNPTELTANASWTLVILENLKPTANMPMGRLTWVLETAMPLKLDFKLQLNGESIGSSKDNISKVIEFTIAELPEARLSNLRSTTGLDWRIKGESLLSSEFPSGITGTILVTGSTLRTGKSDDIMRSHGFFVKVRGRLVNERDPRFGLHELQHQVFNRFRADIDIDDLDDSITAPREGVGDSSLRDVAEKVLNEIFNEARRRYESLTENGNEPRKKEHEMKYVPQSLFEFPTADALSMWEDSEGADADATWFYIRELSDGDSLKETVQDLYSGERTRGYRYDYESLGSTERMVKFQPGTSEFILNDDHEVVRAHKDGGGQTRVLLEDIATAEAMLEVYLREADIPPRLIGDILEKRDKFLRALANDHLTSVAAISQTLLDARDRDHDLEIALVAASRAIGFVAAHIAGPGHPDGIARLLDQPGMETTITLEAKASRGTPSINDIGIGTLADHVREYQAKGCLLVAPDYPGQTRGEDSSISRMATDNGISCWTINQLADVVSATQSRHISASEVLKIILNNFSPYDVSKAVEGLLSTPDWTEELLYNGVIDVLDHLSSNIPDARPTTDMVLGLLVSKPEYSGIAKGTVEEALRAVASSSKGAMVVRGEEIKVNTSIPELRRRTTHITGNPGTPRRNGDFRDEAAN